jgi:MHS family proline/betaine transporter-like MFS transporter
MIGNALEWYDFAIYGYFAVQIGHHFFPHGDAVAQL